MTHASAAGGEFEVLVSDEKGIRVIRPRGELDLASADVLGQIVADIEDSVTAVVIDLAGLTFMDAAGLRVVLEARRTLGDRLTVLPGPPQIRRLFALTRTESEVGVASGATPPEPDPGAANVAYLRALWQSYRMGGVQALARRMPRHLAMPTAGVAPSAWGAPELGAFWSILAALSPDGESTESVGGNVLVASQVSAPSVVWSLYLFDGRTFIRAMTFANEADARTHALRHAGRAGRSSSD